MKKKTAAAGDSSDALLETILEQFREAEDQTQEERALAQRDRDYYDLKQHSAEEIEALKKRGQPVVTTSRLKSKIDTLLGYEKRGRSDPKAYPRTPKHEKDAEAATDALRFVCDQNRWQTIKSNVAENLFLEGIGACTVTVAENKRTGDVDVKLTLVPWDRYYRDPHSRDRHFADKAYDGIVLWKDETELLETYPDCEDVLKGAFDNATEGAVDTYEDRPKFTWADTSRRRVRVLQHFWLHKGQWWTAIACRGGFLRKPQVSPYLDEQGQPESPLLSVSAYVDRENRRYGVARKMISAVDEINKRRSKALHRLTMRQVVAERGAVKNKAEAKRELAKPDGYIEIEPGFKFDVSDNPQALAGELDLLREAKTEIDAAGVSPALDGRQSAPSGRAQEVAQQAGLAEESVPFEALKEFSWRVYRAIWNRVRQYWTSEKWIRVTDDENNLRWVQINKPVTRGEQIIEQAQQAGQPLSPEQVQQIAADPRSKEVARTDNAIAELDVDILVEDGPDSVTVQSEQFDALVELKKAAPNEIPTKLVLQASSLRNKDQIIEALESGGVPPEMQQAMQAAQQKAAELEKQLQAAQAKLQDRAIEQEKVAIDRYKAETERMKVIADANRPPPAQMPPN
jgi:hypothetical protein